MVGEIYTLYNV